MARLSWFLLSSKGKTTLLKHIANRALNIPPNIDVLLCEQGEPGEWESKREDGRGGGTRTDAQPSPHAEVVADETPAVQAVLRADTKRLRLLEEERRLQGQLEQGDDTAAEKLEKVEEMAQGTQGRPCRSIDPWTCVLFSLLPGV